MDSPENEDLVSVWLWWKFKSWLRWKWMVRKLLRCQFLNQVVETRFDLQYDEWEDWEEREYKRNGYDAYRRWENIRNFYYECRVFGDRCGNPDNCDFCDWCGWWGWIDTGPYFTVVLPKYRLVKYRSCEYGSLYLGFVLCLRCVDLYENDKEPPWWPNNRDRYHEMLLRNFQPPAFAEVDSTNILRRIAEYLAENRP